MHDQYQEIKQGNRIQNECSFQRYKPEELNLYAAVSYFFVADYDNAVTFMNYYSEKPYGYDRVMGNAIY